MAFEPIFVTRSVTPTEYSAEIVPGKSITIKDSRNGRVNTFKLGDMAEYDSYNLSYYGKITKITKNTVTIEERYRSDRKSHRLSLYKFAWRNINFKLAEAEKSNTETSYTI